MGRTETVTPESTLPKVAKEPGRGKRLPSQAKHIIENVRQFFENEKLKGSCLKRMSVVERTAAATGTSVRTVHRIHEEIIREGQLLTPVKRYAVSRIRINPHPPDHSPFLRHKRVSNSLRCSGESERAV